MSLHPVRHQGTDGRHSISTKPADDPRPIVVLGYTNPDYINRDLSTPSVPQLDAIDCYFISDASQSDALRRKIPQVAFESTFFTNFWCLILPSGLAGDFISACKNLKPANVNLALIDVANGSCSVILEPDAHAVPTPDRRSLISPVTDTNAPVCASCVRRRRLPPDVGERQSAAVALNVLDRLL
jgi:hypothetical protein